MSNLAGVAGAGAQGLQSILAGKKRVQFIQNNQTVITLDASISETHNRESPPTEFAVESGNAISDHIIQKPPSLEIHGVISDNPIGGLGGLVTEVATSLISKLTPPAGLIAAAGAVGLVSAISGSTSPSVKAYQQLIALQQAGQPFDVLTSLYRYPSMWINSISVPRDAASGRMLLFTVKLTQLLIVSPQIVNIQVFANPGLSSNLVDAGSAGAGIPNGFTQGVAKANAITGVSAGGVNGGGN